MKLIVGLGNPGKEYQKSRHNTGFIFVDELIKHKEIAPVEAKLEFKLNKKFSAEMVEVNREGEKLIIAKPQTFMNLSGVSVKKIFDFYKVEIKDLIVVTDDVDLPVGMVRIRKGGTSGGHNGLQNIIEVLGDANFYRMRIGIALKGDKTGLIDTKDFVLDEFTSREKPVFNEAIELGVNYLVTYIGQKMPMPAHSLEVNRG